jgi:type VI protein secretion system component VasF
MIKLKDSANYRELMRSEASAKVSSDLQASSKGRSVEVEGSALPWKGLVIGLVVVLVGVWVGWSVNKRG